MDVVVTSEYPLLNLPLVTAGWVLTCSVAFSYNSAVVHVSVHFGARVLVVPNIASKRYVDGRVLEIYNSPLLGKLLVSKLSIGLIADPRLTKVYHVSVNAH